MQVGKTKFRCDVCGKFFKLMNGCFTSAYYQTNGAEDNEQWCRACTIRLKGENYGNLNNEKTESPQMDSES